MIKALDLWKAKGQSPSRVWNIAASWLSLG